MTFTGVRHPRFKDMMGQRFGRLTVKSLGETGSGSIKWKCKCDCGNETLVPSNSLRGGNTKSCGCAGRLVTTERNFRHGKSKTPEYAVWNGIITRCYNAKRPEFVNYGGRGITMADRWRHGENGSTGFECFLADVGNRPSGEHSIDRIDNDGNYEPGNCRWSTRPEQVANRRICRYITINGVKRLASEVAVENGVTRANFENRVRRLGWSIERAIYTPVIPFANQMTY